ncbi:MAG: hypothetical protein B6I20_11310 [Bacteroidetes bacterium 4572_117]|nr:MAG: hypothetical protein B6I20_11310 [Bacteroidetes bacterium 4572_117]
MITLKKQPLFYLVIGVFLFSLNTNAQNHQQFTIVKKIPSSSVKSQDRTGTCWSYATISFIESETHRKGQGLHDLSEMYIVRNAYTTKAKKYVRFNGNNNFTEGGQAHDVLNEIRIHGIVPQHIYSGLNDGAKLHNHSEMYAVLNGMLMGLLKSKSRPRSNKWQTSVNSVLDNYLGVMPKEFKYNGNSYTPQSFTRNVLAFNPDDYVELTSYSCYPYYKQSVLEIQDNWSHDLYYNLPVDDLMAVMDYAINRGYSIAWDGDVSEKDFNHKAGTAELSNPEKDGIIQNGLEKWRQQSFDNLSTTDDHLMHITGIAKNKNGTNFYLTKNSWGENSNDYGGYLYMSKWYVQLKTVAIMVHKDAIPKVIRKRLGL